MALVVMWFEVASNSILNDYGCAMLTLGYVRLCCILELSFEAKRQVGMTIGNIHGRSNHVQLKNQTMTPITVLTVATLT